MSKTDNLQHSTLSLHFIVVQKVETFGNGAGITSQLTFRPQLPSIRHSFTMSHTGNAVYIMFTTCLCTGVTYSWGFT